MIVNVYCLQAEVCNAFVFTQLSSLYLKYKEEEEENSVNKRGTFGRKSKPPKSPQSPTKSPKKKAKSKKPKKGLKVSLSGSRLKPAASERTELCMFSCTFRPCHAHFFLCLASRNLYISFKKKIFISPLTCKFFIWNVITWSKFSVIEEKLIF